MAHRRVSVLAPEGSLVGWRARDRFSDGSKAVVFLRLPQRRKASHPHDARRHATEVGKIGLGMQAQQVAEGRLGSYPLSQDSYVWASPMALFNDQPRVHADCCGGPLAEAKPVGRGCVLPPLPAGLLRTRLAAVEAHDVESWRGRAGVIRFNDDLLTQLAIVCGRRPRAVTGFDFGPDFRKSPTQRLPPLSGRRLTRRTASGGHAGRFARG